MRTAATVVGVDFDNTVILYDGLFQTLAAERGLVSAAAGASKKEIRDALRQLPDGEIEWQRLQAAAYGPRIGEGRLAPGFTGFLQRCARAGVKVYVLSHKTLRAGYDETDTNLREAALDWMQAQGLFGAAGHGLARDTVFFSDTRQEKIDRIVALRCTHFIDDLEETFLEASFPAAVSKILFASRPPERVPPGVRVAQSWNQIGEYVFGA